jgi:hypothetical protein
MYQQQAALILKLGMTKMTKLLLTWLALIGLTLSAQAAQTVDGTPGVITYKTPTCTTNAAPNITTAGANELIVVVSASDALNAAGSAPSITSISNVGAASLTWIKAGAASYHSVATGTPYTDIEIWYAVAASAGTYTTILPVNGGGAYDMPDRSLDHLPVGTRVSFAVEPHERSGKQCAVKVAILDVDAAQAPRRPSPRDVAEQIFTHPGRI